jgi:hypothetical protein
MGDFPCLCEEATSDKEPDSIEAILAAMRSPPAHIFPYIPAEGPGEYRLDGRRQRANCQDPHLLSE